MKKEEGYLFKIDKGIPVPPEGHRGKKYPFMDMKAGDSFLVPVPSSCCMAEYRNKQQAISACASTLMKHHKKNRKFTTKVIHKVGIRIWRVK